MPFKASQELIQELNSISVLKMIREMGPISRAELARETGLSRSALTALTRALVDIGLVREVGRGPSRVGRKPILLEFNPEGGLLVGLQMELDHVAAAITDLTGSILASKRASVGADHSPVAVLRQAGDVLNEVLEGAREAHGPYYGVGVSFPGVVDTDMRSCLAWPGAGWGRVSLAEALERRIGFPLSFPVLVEGDVRAEALGEFWFGAGQSLASVVCLKIGNGVGSGVILDGLMHRGANSIAGEIGHTTVDPDGERCCCGNTGCLETKIGATSILRLARERAKAFPESALASLCAGDVTLKKIFELSAKGDKGAQEIFDHVSLFLGIGVATVVNVFDPEAVILTGSVVEASDRLFEAAKRVALSRMLSTAADSVQIRTSSFGEDGPLTGAAALVFQRVVSHPRLLSEREDDRMSVPERFASPSAFLRLGALLRRTQRALLMCLGVALAVHGSLTQLRGWTEERSAAKPLTTQFVNRQPRLTKPLELKKLPRPKRRRIQRELVAVRPSESRRHVSRTIAGSQLVQSLSQSEVRVPRPQIPAATVEFEPQAVAQQIVGAREDKRVVDMSLEMVDVDALDTGQYHALVIQDPSDKRQIKGFFHLVLARPKSLSDVGGRGDRSSVWDDLIIGFHDFIRAVNRLTQIRTDVVGQIFLDDAELFKVPWVITPIPGPVLEFGPVHVTPTEARNMGLYLSMGGFQFLENMWGVPGGHLEKATRAVAHETMESVDLVEGRDWVYERLPKDHPIYHCYYDFDAPPLGADSDCYKGSKRIGKPFGLCDYMEGITIQGRLWILFSQKGHALAYHDWAPYGWYPKDRTRLFQFGINTIVFALTQEGSITNRIMDSVSY